MAGTYYRIKCKCGNEQIVFSGAVLVVNCTKCSETLAHPMGGKAIIHGTIVEELA
ncbi:30S ribosomal protein S27e [Candidatus Micrarchaeota archaeon]|nr:30S ribosomal protein S27e [Candidatus Micrarchaeota archaeon]